MTAYKNCSVTDRLNPHEVYRLTFTPAAGFMGAFLSNASESDTLGAAMANVFAAGTIDGATTFCNVLNVNPYQAGDLAETIDVLVTANGGALSDLLNNILSIANDYSVWSSTDWSNVQVTTCERVVGAGAAAIGTSAADIAAYSPAASSTRAATANAAAADAASKLNSDWLTNLENEVGTVGKYAVIGIGALAVIYLVSQTKLLKRVAG